MGVMDLLTEVTGVFSFLGQTYSCLPVAIRLLILSAFGGVVYISVLKSIWR